ncbi:MAG: ABC transporter permease [Cyclobacteriaceae bacterium]|nr:ABC transporter permease [Cyclobacteriaceae bacterium HetDA_MAG_MS6]
MPRSLVSFFKWYCTRERFEELHGDLEELYVDRLEEFGKNRALVLYVWDVVRCCQPYAWKKLGSQLNSNKGYMLKNYLQIAIRHLRRRPGYSGLNILGLTLGMVSSLIILLYLHQELSFDNYHKDADLIYRISSRFTEGDGTKYSWATTQIPLGQTIQETFGEVDQYVRFIPRGKTRMEHNNISYMVEDVYLVDSTVFDVFSFVFIQGDPATALNEPNSICLSESEALRIFKGADAMGELLVTDDHSFKVTGVYKDQPQHSHLVASAMGSASTIRGSSPSQSWGAFGIYTYVKLSPIASAQVMEDKLNNEIMNKYVRVIFDQYDLKVVYDLLPIRDIHLSSDYEGEPEPLGSMEYIYVFAVVTLFLITIACINYMNLATAQSMRRAQEVGVRKTMGAKRSTLISQFMAESIVIAFVSLILSVMILSIAVPIINNQLKTALDFSQLLDTNILIAIILILVVTGIASGSYPAFYLSAFTPSNVLRGGGAKRSGNPWLRRALVGLQFSISIFMLISTLVVYDQMQYLRSKYLGFDKDQVATFTLNGEALQQWEVLKHRLLQNPNISTLTSASTVPGGGYPSYLMPVEKNDGTIEDLVLNALEVDFEYFSTLGVDILQGRNFSSAFSTDTSHALIVNEAMVRRLGWDNPIGKRIQYGQDSSVFHRVIGVARDFHHSSLHNPIEPLLFAPKLINRRVMLRLDDNYLEAMSFVEHTWEDLFPNLPYESQFLDQRFVSFYENDQVRGNLFLGFSIIMIVIAALGLLGLASFTTEQRSKEISIRKVLGASVQGLVSLMVKEFVLLVLIGAMPAFVCAYLFAENWLGEFEYHVNINFMLFALVVVIIMFVVISATGFHALRAAQANPSDNLKNE